MVRKVFAYNPQGEHVGYINLDTDDIGQPVGEVYDDQAFKLGAIRYKPLDYQPAESEVFEPDGEQVGLVRLESQEDEDMHAEVYWIEQLDAEPQPMAHAELTGQGQVEVYRAGEGGEHLGTLKAEDVDAEELVLVGGGGALLLLL
jgi:hypothetical protein